MLSYIITYEILLTYMAPKKFTKAVTRARSELGDRSQTLVVGKAAGFYFAAMQTWGADETRILLATTNRRDHTEALFNASARQVGQDDNPALEIRTAGEPIRSSLSRTDEAQLNELAPTAGSCPTINMPTESQIVGYGYRPGSLPMLGSLYAPNPEPAQFLGQDARPIQGFFRSIITACIERIQR